MLNYIDIKGGYKMSIFNKKKKVKHIDSIPEEYIRPKVFPWEDEEKIYNLLTNNDDLSRIIVEESFKQNSINDLEEFSFDDLIESIINDSINYTEDSLNNIYKSFGFIYFDRIKKGLFYELDLRKDKLNLKKLLERAEWLIKNGTRVNLLKYAMFVIGKYSEDISIILLLGKNEYFALNAIEILDKKENQEDSMKEIFKNSKGYIKNKILYKFNFESKRNARWLIEEGVNNTVYNSGFAVNCIGKGKVSKELLLDSLSEEYINGVTELLYEIFKEESLYNIKDGGLIINHYVKHIMLRILNGLDLKAKYLCNIYHIKKIITNDENKEYLEDSGLSYNDFKIVVSFVDRAIRYLGWKRFLVRELNEKDHDSFKYIIEAINILKCNIWVQVYNLCIEISDINSNLVKYLILYDNNNNQDKILEIILKKSDVVNIKFPKVENGVILSEECIVIEAYLEKYDKRTKRYLDLIELTASSSLTSLLISSTELLKKWDIPLRDYISIERVEGMLKDEKISNLTKKKLMAIHDNLLLNI